MYRKIFISFTFILLSTISFAQNCQANFSYSIDTATNTVSFTDLSTATDTGDYITSWSWTLGDGTLDSSQNVTHIYNASGAYSVCLTIYTAYGCSSTYCDSVFVGSAPNPCAGFYVTGVVTNESIQGANDGAIDVTVSGGTPSFNYLWSDSSTVEDLANLPAGQYCLTVTDFQGCNYDTCFLVQVTNPVSCTAYFTDSAGTCPNCFSFTDLSSASGTIVSWFWDFGNGNYSTLQNPQQTFLDSGSFVVTLTITTSDSCSSSFSDTVITTQDIQTFSISGQVFVDTAMLSSGTAQLFSNNFSETHPPFYTVQIQNGNYFFPIVASGNYKLLSVPDQPESNNYQSTFFGDKTDYNDAFVLSVYSDLVSVDIHLQPTSNGIQNPENTDIRIYPNPFENKLFIESKEIIQAIQIYSLTGKLLFEKHNLYSNNILLMPENLTKGLYVIRIQTKNSVEFLKIGKI